MEGVSVRNVKFQILNLAILVGYATKKSEQHCIALIFISILFFYSILFFLVEHMISNHSSIN